MSVPTIIFHGDKDRAVPYSQGWEYYRALQQIGKAPVKFIVFPGEPHSLQKPSHQKRKMEEEIAWFDKYLFNVVKAENEALKKGSPLDTALKKKTFAQSHGLYGRIVENNLLPELVRKGSLEVGRFEVTRAQWASFDKTFHFESGTGNYPVNGLSFESVNKYIAWLNNLTGKEFRLPFVSEAEKLAKEGGTSGNTLDYWAGYNLNPDDAQRLLQKVAALGGDAPLLLPVDARPAAGDEMIFGLSGNVSEWAVDDKGHERPVGLSAITPRDPRLKKNSPPKEYIGFRVVIGPKPKAE